MSGRESAHDREFRRVMAGRPPDSPFSIESDREFAAHVARTRSDAHESMALDLWRGADNLGRVVAAVEMMGNNLWDAIAAEADAADRIVIEGPEIIRALRALAMRLDRAVMVKASEGD